MSSKKIIEIRKGVAPYGNEYSSKKFIEHFEVHDIERSESGDTPKILVKIINSNSS